MAKINVPAKAHFLLQGGIPLGADLGVCFHCPHDAYFADLNDWLAYGPAVCQGCLTVFYADMLDMMRVVSHTDINFDPEVDNDT